MIEGKFTLSKPGATSGDEALVEEVDVDLHGDHHGGGDLRLVADFLSVVRGEGGSISTTTSIRFNQQSSHRLRRRYCNAGRASGFD